MVFLANENFPKPSVTILRKAGFEIKSVAEETPGISDSEVIERAKRQHLVILTFDRDYGQLIFRDQSINPPAVVYFRYKGMNPEFAGTVLLDMLTKEKNSLEGNFTVIEKASIRQRKYS